ncbi:hypothetical protein [Methanosarcina acetivorans]|uniref:Methyltransferase domain-containing protein n=1 Tax=Methanosarcina acetivorans (strain ATCC 35395 / DSM 2834 / JCM 12185 / C2A) TaxID=188937 RepID=Q8TKA4_METAC|nr:hypothetical protein [Methanosarcina acetivorans]AAM06872.1 predicted protein [Methanosarcina acetivorans C2A]
MSEVNFNSKAFTYAKNSLVQKSASEVLLNLLSIQPGEDVLDLCCGPGHITKKYEQLFRSCGFDVIHSELREESNLFSPEEAYKIYQSGAENGYLNQSFYTETLTEDYISSFRELVKEAFEEQTDDSDMIDLKFKRIYLIAKKQ